MPALVEADMAAMVAIAVHRVHRAPLYLPQGKHHTVR
jgi:hypothetical protein